MQNIGDLTSSPTQWQLAFYIQDWIAFYVRSDRLLPQKTPITISLWTDYINILAKYDNHNCYIITLGRWANGLPKGTTRYNYSWPWSQWIKLPKVSTRCRTVSPCVLTSSFALMVSGLVAYLGMQLQNHKSITSTSTFSLIS